MQKKKKKKRLLRVSFWVVATFWLLSWMVVT